MSDENKRIITNLFAKNNYTALPTGTNNLPNNRCLNAKFFKANFLAFTERVKDNQLIPKGKAIETVGDFYIDECRDIIFHKGVYYLIGNLGYQDKMTLANYTSIVGIEENTTKPVVNGIERVGKWKFYGLTISVRDSGTGLAGYSDGENLYLALQSEADYSSNNLGWSGNIIRSGNVGTIISSINFNSSYVMLHRMFVDFGKLVLIVSEDDNALNTQIYEYDYSDNEIAGQPNPRYIFTAEYDMIQNFVYMQKVAHREDYTSWYLGHTFGHGVKNTLRITNLLVNSSGIREIGHNDVSLPSEGSKKDVSIGYLQTQGFNSKAIKTKAIVTYHSFTDRKVLGRSYPMNTFGTSYYSLLNEGDDAQIYEILGVDVLEREGKHILHTFNGELKLRPTDEQSVIYYIHLTDTYELNMFAIGMDKRLTHKLSFPKGSLVKHYSFVNDTLIVIYEDSNSEDSVYLNHIKMVKISDIEQKYLSL